MTSLLLIDDDPQFCSMLAERLRREGYAVTTAADGRPGLVEFRRTDYALVILDIILPDMEGLETLHELRRVKASAKVIAISGGKLTTFRATAAQVLRRVASSLPSRRAVADVDTLPLTPA